MPRRLTVRCLGVQPYENTWEQMKVFTDKRDGSVTDELWLVEHTEVYTLGQAGRKEHLLNPGKIPVIRCDRGGQVTYHGPGQLVVYLLFDLRRAGINVRELVSGIEGSIIRLLAEFDLAGTTRAGAPGVYAGDAKIAALGLRIRRGCSYHGFSLNLDIDLERFARIDPCGYKGLAVTDLGKLGVSVPGEEVAARLVHLLSARFGYHAFWPSPREGAGWLGKEGAER